MDLMTKLERKFGKHSIPNLTVILISGFVLGYMIEIFAPEALQILALNPAKVMRGQVYRLITWIVIPPYGASVFVIITLFFYFSIGRTLERVLGDFRYTVYILSGIIFTDLGIMLTYIIMKMMGKAAYLDMYYSYGLFGASTYYLCMSMFLAYAFMFPENQVLLYFFIPVKIKWLGYLDIAYLIVEFLRFGMMGYYTGMVTVVMSVFNFIIFYIASKGKGRSHSKRKRQYRSQVRQTQIMTRHKCAICGQTEEDNPELEFRYCSRCNGNHEYCQNHLFTHEHKK
ncbi:MAG: hypothetical protein Q4D51_12210 [Eubacteriales bacterium]|nr:hypothetical protein [Eubacteriales bacterium]